MIGVCRTPGKDYTDPVARIEVYWVKGHRYFQWKPIFITGFSLPFCVNWMWFYFRFDMQGTKEVQP
jgi:hypothetical protein